jgi:hypothetical protein
MTENPLYYPRVCTIASPSRNPIYVEAAGVEYEVIAVIARTPSGPRIIRSAAWEAGTPPTLGLAAPGPRLRQVFGDAFEVTNIDLPVLVPPLL